MNLIVLPDEIASTPSLRYLDVSGNLLTAIPDAYVDATSPIGKQKLDILRKILQIFHILLIFIVDSAYY